jgi:hypothetical protein
MSRRIQSLGRPTRSAAVLALVLVAGCAQVLGIETLPEGTGGGSSEAQCSSADLSACPPPPGGSSCLQTACTTDGRCATIVAPAGTPVASQIEGDCRVTLCQPDGSAASTPDPDDAKNDGRECTVDACDSTDNATHTPTAKGTACSTGVCDGAGRCVECLTPMNCGSEEVCKEDRCVPRGCDNTTLDGEETDVDCGGSVCPPCTNGQKCQIPADCASGVCESAGGGDKFCAESGCDDGIRNGDETGVDCGGSCPKACSPGTPCLDNDDCESLVCSCPDSNPTCSMLVCQPPRCNDGTQNGDEVEVDCGPDCTRTCNDGDPCVEDKWCVSFVCDPSAGVCLEPTCDDGKRNQDETGVDCGGSCPTPCASNG